MTEPAARPLTTRSAARAAVGVLVVLVGLVAPVLSVGTAYADPSVATTTDDAVLRAELTDDAEAYLAEYGAAEHASAVGLSVSLPDRRSSIDVSAGTTTVGGSEPVTPSSVWQIGSNTKAFTSVLLLQLEAEGELSIDDPLSRWLPEYPQWGDVTIKRLLNMTSGIPTYDVQPAWYTAYAADPMTEFSAEDLVGYAVGLPATSGYSYSNTNYVLAELIIERVTGDSYRHVLQDRLLEPLCLQDTYYRPHLYPERVTDREPAGYFAKEGFPGWLGRDTSRDTLSWARGAGGIIATTGDMTRWERALYAGELLPAEQQAELLSLVSATTGEPIDRTSLADPFGFGLGVAQLTVEGYGTFWFYEGQTLGFRALHAYLPETSLILAIGVNSATTEDHVSELLIAAVDTLVENGVVPAGQAAA